MVNVPVVCAFISNSLDSGVDNRIYAGYVGCEKDSAIGSKRTLDAIAIVGALANRRRATCVVVNVDSPVLAPIQSQSIITELS